jgi:hypothetical protein
MKVGEFASPKVIGSRGDHRAPIAGAKAPRGPRTPAPRGRHCGLDVEMEAEKLLAYGIERLYDLQKRLLFALNPAELDRDIACLEG